MNVASLPFSFSLSEIADSVIATYTRTGGSADPNSPHKLVFGAGSETVKALIQLHPLALLI